VVTCLLILLSAPASGKIVIDMPFFGPQQLPVDIPFLENVSIGSSTPASAEYLGGGWEIRNGDFTVGAGHVLSMRDYALLFNCSSDGQYKINVLDGGTLLIENCTITSLDGTSPYLFQIQPGGRLVMKNSSLSHCGFNSPYASSKGLWLGSDGNSLAFNELTNNYYGIVVEGGRSSITNNSITYGHCGIQIGKAGAVVTNNTIDHNQVGIDASQSGITRISGNTITNNALYGMLIGGEGPGMLTGNDISNNGEGLIILNASTCLASETRLDDNRGHGLVIEGSRVVSIKNVSSSWNAWGVYVNGTRDCTIHWAETSYNMYDGVFINNSNNVVLIDDAARYNGGYGFNVSENNTGVTVDRRRNIAEDNFKGDFNAPPAALSIAEVSLLSLLIALLDKLIYLIDFQKVIVTNMFSGIVNPMREPVSRELDRLSHRLLSIFHITRRGYKKAHVSEHMNVLFFHLINGKDIRGVVRPSAPAKLSSHEIVLQQVRFFDLLFRDRVMLYRNILYMAITTGAGIIVYTLQVWAGTYDLPYFLPLALQFLVMFPIGLAVQGNVVGHVEKLEYDVRDEVSVEMLRDDTLRQMSALEELHSQKKISDKKFDLQVNVLSDALKAIDHMDVRRHYLLFTPEGYAKAISGFESLLQKSPDEPLFLAGAAEAHAMLGRSLEMGGGTGKGHFETAMEYAQKAFSLDGSRFEVRRARAMGLYFNGQTGDARNEVDEAIQLCPNDAESYLLKAMMSENSEERARLYRKAISLNKSLSAIRLEPLIVPVPAIEKTRENYRARR
jgi:hypothetical protein